MTARMVCGGLVALTLIMQWQLWIGRGSIPNVRALNTELAAVAERNKAARDANTALAAEVQDLKEGLEMVEEKARFELGMVKPNEVFVQYSKR
jgi:cell division protein FtsB